MRGGTFCRSPTYTATSCVTPVITRPAGAGGYLNPDATRCCLEALTEPIIPLVSRPPPHLQMWASLSSAVASFSAFPRPNCCMHECST